MFPHWKSIGGLVEVVLFIIIPVKILSSFGSIQLHKQGIKIEKLDFVITASSSLEVKRNFMDHL